MAATDYPTTGQVTFGVYSYPGFITQSYDLTSKPQVVAEVFDENGRRVHVRYDDQTTEGAIEMRANGGNAPVAGEVLTYNSVKYEITEVNIKGQNKDFVTYSVKLKRSEAVNLP